MGTADTLTTGPKLKEAEVTITRGTFFTASLIYLTLPIVIFFFGYLKIVWALLFSALTITAVVFAIKRFKQEGSKDHTDKITLKPSYFAVVIPLIIIFLFLGGVSEYSWTTIDHRVRYAILNDLINYKWPVIFDFSTQENPIVAAQLGEGKVAFAYYFVFWMVPAVVGKLFGLLAARIVLLIWSAIGLILIAIGALILYGKQSRFLFIGLVLFAGFDVFPYLYNEYISGFGATWEDWTWHFRVVGNFYQLMNVFHQSLPGWLITLLLLLCTNSKSIGLLGSLMFCYSPWAAIGVLPMCICKLIITNRRLKAKEVLKNLFTIGNLVAPVVFLVCFATFYTANSNATYDYGFIWTFYGNKFTMVIDYVAYVVFEFGLWVLLIHKKYKKDWMFYCAILTMLIIPIYKMTGPNDLLMRGSMAPLFAIGLYAVMFVTDSFNEMMEKGNKKVKPRLVVLSLLVAACTSFNFMLTSTLLTFMTYAKMEPETDIKTGIESFGNINDEQYIVMVQAQFYVYDYENNVFFKYLAK